MHILFVDDDRFSRVMLAHGLRHHGLTVTEADSAAQALEVLQEQSFDVMLSDIQMPTMDGPTLAAELRRREIQPIMRLVAISGSILTVDDRSRLLGLFDAVVSKPISADDLVTILVGAHSRAGLGGQAA
ncbi:MAG: response regulator [Burkholderiaceae bacterium]